MANDAIITEFKNKIIEKLQNNEQIIQALDLDKSEDKEDLAYVRLFPYYFIVPTQEDAKTYIFVEVALEAVQDRYKPLRSNIVYDQCSVYIYVVAHQTKMKMEEAGQSAVRIDYISQLITEELNGSTLAGIGMLQRISNLPRTINDTYRCREMKFIVPDFNKEMCKSNE